MIYIGADHRGFELKEFVKKRLIDEGYEVTDLGDTEFNPNDDYVTYSHKVAEATVADPKNKGIVMCGSGAGVDMVANKVDGVRSALVFDLKRAILARQHEDANVIALPADVLEPERAYEIIKAFLTTEFSGEERHIRRLEEMKEVEEEKEENS